MTLARRWSVVAGGALGLGALSIELPHAARFVAAVARKVTLMCYG
jgi:hypothetical protein